MFSNCCNKGKQFYRNWIGFFILGTINNLAYVVVNSAAQSLAISFNQRNLLALIPWANVASGLLVRGVNTVCLEGIAYHYRMIGSTVMAIIGLVGIAMSVYVNFIFALLMIVIIGSFSSFGESVLLGYQRKYPAEMVGGWSSGTGMAGISGSLLYILFNAVLLFSNQETFICLLPTTIIYMMAYGLILQEPLELSNKSEKVSSISHPKEELDDETNELIPKNEKVIIPTKETSRQRYWRCTKLVFWQAMNLMWVYFFEYVASVGAADRSEHPGFQHSTDWFVRNSYVLLAFCYQFGVFFSRSSLQIIRIRRVEILTILQALNFVLWMLQAQYKMMPIEAQLPLMFYVGLLGGASYVNVFYNLLHDEEYPDEDRELIVNIAALFINLGIMLASGFSLIMAQTVWKNL